MNAQSIFFLASSIFPDVFLSHISSLFPSSAVQHNSFFSNRSHGGGTQKRADWEANHALLSITLIKTWLSTLLSFHITRRASRVVLFLPSSPSRLPVFPITLSPLVPPDIHASPKKIMAASNNADVNKQ